MSLALFAAMDECLFDVRVVVWPLDPLVLRRSLLSFARITVMRACVRL